jgi:small subunit ribosomal protein S8
MTTDLISNMLISLQNAIKRQYSVLEIPYSNSCLEFIKVLYKAGLIKSYTFYIKNIEENSTEKIIRIILRYTGHWIPKPLFTKITQISKQGKRVYIKGPKLKKILLKKNFSSIYILSTSSGIMTHIQAYNLKKGGEILCCISN